MKKLYFEPKFKVVEMNEADIICESPGEEASLFSIEDEGYEEENW